MPRHPMPPEAGLEQLLRECWEFTPGPDMARLGQIESRLLRAARRPAASRRAALPWWAILLLAGGAATAAWWAGEILTEQKQAPERYTIEAVEPAPPETGRKPTATPEPATGDRSRIIYEREAP